MRGFGEEDFREVARIAVASLQDDADVDVLAERSVALCERHPLYPGFRGWTTYEA
jgi:glycine hydroxymethyltransferase